MKTVTTACLEEESFETGANSTGLNHVDLGILCSQYEHDNNKMKGSVVQNKPRDSSSYHMRKLKKQSQYPVMEKQMFNV